MCLNIWCDVFNKKIFLDALKYFLPLEWFRNHPLRVWLLMLHWLVNGDLIEPTSIDERHPATHLSSAAQLGHLYSSSLPQDEQVQCKFEGTWRRIIDLWRTPEDLVPANFFGRVFSEFGPDHWQVGLILLIKDPNAESFPVFFLTSFPVSAMRLSPYHSCSSQIPFSFPETHYPDSPRKGKSYFYVEHSWNRIQTASPRVQVKTATKWRLV